MINTPQPPREFSLASALRWAWVALAVCLLSATVAGGVWALKWVQARPIEHVVFRGDIRPADPIDALLLSRFVSRLQSDIGRVDIHAVKAELRRLPWVRDASVRRRLPNSLEIELEAHRVIARFGENDLLNDQGERFSAELNDDLPLLEGPDGTEREMADTFRQLKALLTSQDMVMSELRLSGRRAWQVQIEGGPLIELGRADLEPRLKRYLAVVRVLPDVHKSQRVDARYARALAVLPRLESSTGH